jgi:peptidoglycan/xylan/chitin deacetylase (PgdA/CDA1 family)
MRKIFIVTYHSVQDWEYVHSIHKQVFERQLRHLKSKFDILTFDEFIEVVAEQKTLERDAVLITFDDGVQDNYTNAFPILKKLNVPAVIFVCTGIVGKDHSGPRGYVFRFLEWKEMREMQESGLVSIQSHTHLHPLLTQVSADVVREEFQVSKKEIEEHLGISPRALAYPKGDYNDTIISEAQKYYDYAFAVDGGYEEVGRTKKHAITRFLISQNIPMWKFKLMFIPFFWKLRQLKNIFFK